MDRLRNQITCVCGTLAILALGCQSTLDVDPRTPSEKFWVAQASFLAAQTAIIEFLQSPQGAEAPREAKVALAAFSSEGRRAIEVTRPLILSNKPGARDEVATAALLLLDLTARINSILVEEGWQ